MKIREIIFLPDRAHVLLTQGQFAIIDLDDVHKVEGVNWCAAKKRLGNFYAKRFAYRINGKCVFISMHRIILDLSDDLQCDHINMDTLDNRSANLRAVTRSGNQRNRGKTRGNKSGFKGVRWHKEKRKWQAEIRHEGKYYYLGGFINSEDAARGYDMAARIYHGEHARLNFPDESKEI